MTGRRVIRRALANQNILAAQIGFLFFSIAEYATWLALLLFAFDRGGVAETGLVAFVLLLPAAAIAPFAAVVLDRLRQDLALAAGFGLQAATAALTAVAMSMEASAALIYLGAGLFVAVLTVSRPTISAALPAISDNPEELAAANSIAGFVETVSAFIGPAAAGLMLVNGSPATVFAVSAALLGAAAGLALTMRVTNITADDDEDGEAPLSELLGGFRLLRAEAAPRLLVVMLAGTWLIFGALDVAFLAIAIDQLGRSEATAGLLASALGVGGVLGSLLSFALVGRRRLSLPTAAGLVLIAVPIMALAASKSLVLIVVLLAAAGIGEAVADVAGRTLLQGLAAEDTLARIFGVLEGVATAALAVGSVAFSLIAVWAGLPAALLAVGLLPALFLAVNYRKLRAIDHARPDVDPLLLKLVRDVPIFAPLPAFRVEQLLVNLQAAELEPGRVVFNKGDRGDHFYLVAAGSAVVELDHRRVVQRRGQFFGEIALVTNQPRMATVRAGDDGLVVYGLERQVFLDAITSFSRSKSRTVREAQRRLNEG